MKRWTARPRPFPGWRSGRIRPLSIPTTALALLGFVGLGACAPRASVAPGSPRSEPAVRVGLAVDTTEMAIGATSDWEVVDAGSGRVLQRFAAGDRATVTSGQAGELRVRVAGQDGDPETVGEATLVIRPGRGDFVVIGGRPYRGSALIRSAGPGRLTAINQVDMESYLLGVVPHEIGDVGPELLEAAKAQAVAARTYAIRYLGRRGELGFDVYATVEDQVYGGAEGEHETTSRAVRETAGEILTFAEEPIDAFYHSTCSGRTAAIEEVWPDEPPRPYLVSVMDVDPVTGVPFDVSSSRFRWTERWTVDELRQIFSSTLADSLPADLLGIGELRDLRVLDTTPSGRIQKLRVTTDTGDVDVGGDRIRWVFLTPAGNILNSSRFDVHLEHDPAGRIAAVVAEGMGWGHGIGMCQVGAMGRARAGQDYRTILRAYYTGASLVPLY